MTIRNRGIRGVYMETNTSVYGVLGAESNSLTIRGGYLSQILTSPFTTVNAQVLIVAGGGGGGYDASGGGGAGGLYYSNNLSISNTNYTVTIGAGGTGGISGAGIGKSGSNTTFGSYTVIGGGGGAGATATGADGGSGGGGGGWDGGVSVGGSSIQNTTFGYGVGNAGGTGGSNANWPAGGGGGAGSRGANSSGASAGAGGNGLAYNFANGTSVYYAGGGGGGGSSSTIGGTGGLGGGGAGVGSSSALSGYTGSAGTGGGGGGSGHFANGGSGGSGIAIISYPIPQQFSGGVVTNLNGTNVVHTFTTSGSLNALATPIDTYFPQTTLLLHGDGTNGANNTVFVDSSTNAFTVTTNGKPLQGTFSPFSQTGWSNYFDGTGDYLTVPTGAFVFGSNNFTIETWIYTTAYNTSGNGGELILDNWINSSPNYITGQWQLWLTSAGVLKFSYASGSSTGVDINSSTNPSLNTWNHIAVVKSSSTVTMYLNGISVATATVSISIGASGTSSIGRQSTGNPWTYTGYISNVRVLNGTALYTSNFTPSLTPLTAITNTQLLTCQDNRFKDNSINNYTITPAGDASVQPFSPFAPSAAYSNSAIGGSIRFNGSSDYVTHSGTNFAFGTGDFTIEAWVYPLGTPSVNYMFWGYRSGNDNSPYLFWSASQGLTFGGDTTNFLTYTTSLTKNAWQHIAVTRSSTSLKMFYNGTVVASNTNSTNFSDTNTKYIGAINGAAPYYYNGYISNLRVLKGTAQYTSNFTPSTSPLTAVANTTLLLNATNAGIIDQTAKNTLTTYGSAAISSTQSKFGGTSMYFDGTGDYLTIPNSDLFKFGSGDFTIEAWVNTTALGGQNGIYCKREVGTYAGVVFRVLNTTSKLVMQIASSSTAWAIDATDHGLPALSTNTWYHVALVRNGNSFTIYQNGVGGTAATYAGSIYDNNSPSYIGVSDGSGGNQFWNGYIDDFRISKFARYTSNFTPPTSTFLDR